MKNGDKAAYPLGTSLGYNEGLTKREYFAAMAMRGMLTTFHIHPSNTSLATDISFLAEGSIACADALLSKLDKTESK